MEAQSFPTSSTNNFLQGHISNEASVWEYCFSEDTEKDRLSKLCLRLSTNILPR